MLEGSPRNKMMQAPPAKKGFHFAATAEHLSEFIEAEGIEEATETYHKIKRLINPSTTTEPAAITEPEPEEKEPQ